MKITCPAHCSIAGKYNLIGVANEKKKKAVCSCLIWISFHSGAMGRSRDFLCEAIFVPGPRADKDDFFSTSLKPSWNVSLAQSYLNPEVSVVWERENGVFVEFTNKSEVSALSLETFGSKLCKFYLFYSSGNINLTQPPTCLVSWDLMRLNRLLHCKSYLHSSVCAFAPLTLCPHTWWQFSVRNDFFPYLGLPWLSFNTDRRPDSGSRSVFEQESLINNLPDLHETPDLFGSGAGVVSLNYSTSQQAPCLPFPKN